MEYELAQITSPVVGLMFYVAPRRCPQHFMIGFAASLRESSPFILGQSRLHGSHTTLKRVHAGAELVLHLSVLVLPIISSTMPPIKL
jgi:hypothetical protein